MIEDYDNVDYEYFKEWDLEQAKKEIERLNNIIGELEKYLNDDDWTSVNGVIAIKLIKIKLKELKEGK